jgi:hypothetical protein
MRRRAGSRLDVAETSVDLMVAEQMLDLMRRLGSPEDGRDITIQLREVADLRGKLEGARQ